MLLISRQKDYRWQIVLWQSLENFKPVHAGHLHVKKHNIGSEFENFLDRRRAIAALANDLDILESFHPKRDSAPR
jgi:hypothetical protein